MIIELLKVKLPDLSFDLAVKKCLAMEQANKDVQVLPGVQEPGTSVHLHASVATKDAGSPG